MDIVESLSKKVHEAAQRIRTLEEERRRFMAEIEHLKLQVKRHHELTRENDNLKKSQDTVRNRLLRLQKKIDKQLIMGMEIPVAAATEIKHEEPVQ